MLKNFLKLKSERNLTFHETAKILGTSNVKLLELLREKEILFKMGNRNLPIDKYISKGWFEVYKADIGNSNFIGSVPIVRITNKGFDEIKKLALSNPDYLKRFNSLMFQDILRNKISDSLERLGLSKYDNDEWISANSVQHTDSTTGNCSIFILHNEVREYLVVFNKKKKEII